MADEKEKKVKDTQEVETPDTSTNEDKPEEKTFTQAELDEILKKRLAREAKDAEAKIKEAQSEAERLAKLSAEEKEKELVEKSKREMEAKMREVSVRENRLDAIELFNEAKVPINLVDYVVDEDKEKTLENAKVFSDMYNESVSKSVAEQLKGTPPKDISTNSKEQPAKKVVTAF
jgi:hypothetical protein